MSLFLVAKKCNGALSVSQGAGVRTDEYYWEMTAGSIDDTNPDPLCGSRLYVNVPDWYVTFWNMESIGVCHNEVLPCDDCDDTFTVG